MPAFESPRGRDQKPALTSEEADVWPDLRELRGRGPVVLGLLTGLEMMRRVDPAAVSDEMAIAALRGAIADDQERTP